MRPRVWIVPALGVTVVTAIACYDAPQTIQGGDPLFDAALVVDAGACGDALVPTDAANTTWTSLYADLFGPASIGQCGAASRTGTGTTSCHHDGAGNGAISSGFICGDTQESCYMGITSPNAQFVGEQVVAPCAPGSSYLLDVLRHDGGGLMPYYPETVVFADTDMARVRAWISAGAPNN